MHGVGLLPDDLDTGRQKPTNPACYYKYLNAFERPFYEQGHHLCTKIALVKKREN